MAFNFIYLNYIVCIFYYYFLFIIVHQFIINFILIRSNIPTFITGYFLWLTTSLLVIRVSISVRTCHLTHVMTKFLISIHSHLALELSSRYNPTYSIKLSHTEILGRLNISDVYDCIILTSFLMTPNYKKMHWTHY